MSAASTGSSGARGKRVFVAAFAHETNTFHPVRTSAFRYGRASDQPLPVWQEAGLVILPGVTAYPAGGGTVDEGPCREAMARVLHSLRSSLPVDAVYLNLHGAMYADGIGPAETVLVEEVRAIVGPGVPIACTFDLHGNLPARLAVSGDILVGLKTAPHTDGAETAALAGRLLLETLEGRISPVSHIVPLPMLLPGEKAMTTAEPFRSLVEEARRLEQQGLPGQGPRILAATILVGCAWTDSPDTGMAAMVTADGSRDTARAAAAWLAAKVWSRRHEFAFGCEVAELEEGVERALAAREVAVFLTDSGDNVTASAPGDLPVVLRHLVERQAAGVLVAGINDPDATARCFAAGEGQRLRLAIGASIEQRHGPPLEAEVQVVRLVPEARQVVVRIGTVEAILAAGPTAFVAPRQFEACGIEPLSRRLVVVKEGYLFPELSRVAPRHIMLLTPGAGDMRLERLTYRRRRRSLYPFEPDTPFTV